MTQPNSIFNSRDIISCWRTAFQRKTCVFIFGLVLCLAFVSLYISGQWLVYNETRDGTILRDPILALFSPINLNIPLAIITNTAVIIGVVSSMLWPYHMIRTMLCIMLIVYFRMVVMYLIPLDPPIDIIPLRDVFLENAFYNGQVLMKDLFFSGHVSNLILLILLTPFKAIKQYITISVLIVGPMLLLQHVHYSIDVLVAPLFSFAAYTLANKILEKFEAQFDSMQFLVKQLSPTKIR